MGPGQPDTRISMGVPRVLVLSIGPDGIFLDRFEESGAVAGDTWHKSIAEAKAQAIADYGNTIGPWVPVPAGEDDPFSFAMRATDADS